MLNPRELATVLAALRHWQQQLARQGLALADAFPQFADERPLSMEEIDSLCDLLNDSDTPVTVNGRASSAPVFPA